MKTLYLGLDLTDGYSRHPRPVDVAHPDADSREVRFTTLAWGPGPDPWPLDSRALVRKLAGGQRAVFVLDGPQALASPPRGAREAERGLRTPGRTPSELPVPGSKPFAGYLRSSVEGFARLVERSALDLADLDGTTANGATLLEAYPGAAWPVLAGRRLAKKKTRQGREERRDLLLACGLGLPECLPNHDQLDAALCALLGWWLQAKTPRAQLVGESVYRDGAVLREGRILMPTAGAGLP
jgi:hypothetical protein